MDERETRTVSMGMSSSWLDTFMPFMSPIPFMPSMPVMPFIPFMSMKPSSRSMAAGPASPVPSMDTSSLSCWARKESFSAGDTTMAGASGCADDDDADVASTIGSSMVWEVDAEGGEILSGVSGVGADWGGGGGAACCCCC